ncbi:MAG: metallophosphoesterase [Pirellulaceae bacterium]|nr:metallophosphoesterase [Pirellulaceae bacterium]
MNQSATGKALSRRKWLKVAGGCTLGGVGIGAWTVMLEPHWLTVQHYRLPLVSLPSHWHGKRLVQISDLHVGRVSIDYLQGAMQQVNELEPDVLVITGDFVDYHAELSGDLQRVLKQLKPAKIATLGCLGNHDFGRRWSEQAVADFVTETAKQREIQVLRNQWLDLDGLHFLGFEDYWSPNSQPQPLLQQARPDLPTICLCHNPDTCDIHDWSGLQGIVLAGHTHGGQCKPPFLPPPILPVFNRRYTSGFFELAPNRQLFITRGLGYTHQMRFNCRPEISVFTLQAV